ncbi:MAG: GGDEF domain-containing protein [Gemmataceae bacterium]|nr:GGDEF domain-containing protein [Gemmataceae bacterium]
MLARRRPRALIAAGSERQAVFAALFTHPALAEWDTLAAQTFGQARFMLQHQTFDVVLVSGDLAEREGSEGLAWLTGQRQTPLVFLGDDRAAQYAHAYAAGVADCLPRSLILAHPPLLVAAMQHAIELHEALGGRERILQQLAEGRRQVDRLAQLIWRTAPRHADAWHSQRQVLERLDEEAARCRRHRTPLTVAVGAWQAETQVADWASEAIVRGKRRSDVVGQWGPDGFLMLMVQTPKPGGVACCRRLQEVLEHPADHPAGPHAPVYSYFGIATASAERYAPQSLLHVAEQNLEAARRGSDTRIVAN